MAGLLGDIYSYGDTLKRRVNGLLADPRGTLEQFVGQMGDQANQNSDLMNQAGWMPIAKTNATKEQQAMARALLAEQGSQMGMAGAVYVGKNKIADNAYHGAGKDFKGRFDPDMAGSANADQHGSYWLTSDWGQARGYSVAADRNNMTKPIVKEANVFLKNPMEVDAMQAAKNLADDVGVDQPTTWEDAAELLQYNQWLNDSVFDAKKMGHDGLIVRNTGDAPGTAGGLADHFAIFNANRARFIK